MAGPKYNSTLWSPPTREIGNPYFLFSPAAKSRDRKWFHFFYRGKSFFFHCLRVHIVSVMSTAGREMMAEMEKMSIEQLKAVKEQSDMEVGLLQDSVNNIRTAATRLEKASVALQDLSQHPQGKKMLVPLTSSLYVSGTLDDANKVLIDVGTGYFIEKSMLDGKDYCERKINFLKSNYEELIDIAGKKKNVADEVGLVLQAKLRQAPRSS